MPDKNWREELPKIAERNYTPKNSEHDLLLACKEMMGFGRSIPIKYWDDWVLEETDELITFYGVVTAGQKMKQRMNKSGMAIMRAVWSNILKGKGEK